MPSRVATRRASSTASREQHPWCLSKSRAAISFGHNCSVTPKTSWPSSRIIAAATDESTPPLMATATFTPAPTAGRRCRDFGSTRGRGRPPVAHRRDPARPSHCLRPRRRGGCWRSEEHTSELQSRFDLVCRLLLEKKKKKKQNIQQ